MSAVPLDEEFCPSCGRMVAFVIEASGWCASCTKESHPDNLYCEVCRAPFPASSGGKLCEYHKLDAFLGRNADRLDSLLSQGNSLQTAIKVVRDENRPVCRSCGTSIKGAKAGAVFCKQKPQCRSASRRYRTLIEGRHRFHPEIALEQVLRELEAQHGGKI